MKEKDPKGAENYKREMYNINLDLHELTILFLGPQNSVKRWLLSKKKTENNANKSKKYTTNEFKQRLMKKSDRCNHSY